MALTRYGSNPVLETQGDSESYDYGKVFCQVLKFSDSDYRCWYSAGEDSVEVKRRPPIQSGRPTSGPICNLSRSLSRNLEVA